jgi:CheY-like chemotaxis protein
MAVLHDVPTGRQRRTMNGSIAPFGTALWVEGGVRCLLLAAGSGSAVELRNDRNVAFIRKHAPTPTAARNEAEYLRLLMRRPAARASPDDLQPFALIVEDEPDTADAYREALRLTGVRALAVRTGRDGLKHALELRPDLIILDYRLPDMHGGDVCRRLRADPATTGIPVLVVTASPQDEPACRADAVLTKPCLLPTLLAAARVLLRRARPAGRTSATAS